MECHPLFAGLMMIHLLAPLKVQILATLMLMKEKLYGTLVKPLQTYLQR